MSSQSFTEKNFSYLTRQGDYWSYFKASDGGDSNQIKKNLLLNLEKNLNVTTYKFTSIKSVKALENTIFLLKNTDKVQQLSDDFILRKINRNILRTFKVKQADRFKIISHVQKLLSEPLPFYVCKLDIKDFYESINSQRVLDKVNHSAIVSLETKRLLKSFFQDLPKDLEGLPRGINISATLSELYMKKFDRQMIQSQDFYYYARFVDDIILFSQKPIEKEQVRRISEELNYLGLNINYSKTELYNLTSSGNDEEFINYLGYKFKCCSEYERPQKNKIVRNTTTSISDKKINKYKTKIIKSFIDYNQNRDFKLLKDRILFLTSTYPLKTKRQHISKYETTGSLHGGIPYSYPLINDLSCLKGLDHFLRNIIFSAQLSRMNNYLTNGQKEALKKYSFYHGFKRRIVRIYDIDRLTQISSCWGK